MKRGIISVIGNTPTIELERYLPDADFQLYAKLEGFNPGGSAKDRPAFRILREALERGEIDPDTVILESSSGNMGIGLAQVCAYYGLRFVCIVDSRTTTQNIRILEAYGARVDVVTDPGPDGFFHARLQRLRELQAQYPKSFWTDQHANARNAEAHLTTTMEEIAAAAGGELDYLFAATSTCGTIRGCSEYIRARGMRTKVVAVDSIGSVIFGGAPGPRLVPGLGAGERPGLYRPEMADEVVLVSDLDCVVGCRRLVRREGILAGGSAGAVMTAVERMRDRIPPASRCAVILCDRGERYLETIYDDAWVEEKFGPVSHLWTETALMEEYV
ncbi:MAG TPA: 2,3-diaminopropionate biosynthesis protein SbnA [Longimicrobiaceae bacterium]|nr:2,3-diaminopropionate biosynthesis protein SbnA [Longimicrobiaceae bacterium]